jgi:hypothetical protein
MIKISVIGLRRKRCPVTLTRTACVQFIPAPTHEKCLCCFAKSYGLSCDKIYIECFSTHSVDVVLY